MTDKRFRFTIRQLLMLTVAIAGTTGLLVSFGQHFLFASRHVIVPRYRAFTKIDNRVVSSDCELTTCSFSGLSFDVPTSMIGSAKIVRSSPADAWLAFEDATRMMQIPLVPSDMRNAIATTPSELNDLPTPKLLEVSVSAASDDFSLAMSKADLKIHDWAIETRSLLNLDAQNMDRYSQVSSDDIDAILISADPVSIDSNRRLRSILAWESRDRRRFGSIWFGDSRNVEAGWIDAAARSIAVVSEDRLTTTELLKLSDSEILSRLRVSGLPKNK